MYRSYLTQDEYDEIVCDYDDPKTPPHCNSETFHEPGVCAFCDGYYVANPRFIPAVYATPEANGWGGNMAPKVDDQKAIEEERAWSMALAAIRDSVEDREHPWDYWRDQARRIKSRFLGGNDVEAGPSRHD